MFEIIVGRSARSSIEMMTIRKTRPTLFWSVLSKIYSVHRTIHEHNIQRQDFERLCSNHTIKQYDLEYENTRKRLSGQPGSNTLQFMNKKIKLEFGDTLKLNKAAGKI